MTVTVVDDSPPDPLVVNIAGPTGVLANESIAVLDASNNQRLAERTVTVAGPTILTGTSSPTTVAPTTTSTVSTVLPPTAAPSTTSSTTTTTP